MSSETLLKMTGIDKRFTGVNALSQVDFDVNKVEVHALMGENGAGKSTLIKVLTGIYTKDAGEIFFEGKEIHPNNPLDAQNEGISPIYQELNLVGYQTVYENIFLGHEPMKRGMLDRKKMIAGAQKILEEMNISVNVNRPLNNLSTAIQQMVALARAITIRAKLVVMDEPTSSLDSKEVKVLFDVIRKLVADGISVLFITHRLDEVFEISDRVTILKDGSLVGCYQTSELDKYKLISLMIGRDTKTLERNRPAYDFRDALSVLEAKGICRGVYLSGIDIEIKKGEVLGLAGLLGSGRTEIAKVLFGVDIPDGGIIYFSGDPLKLKTPGDAIRAGMGFCTEDRKVEGIIPHMSVRDNLTIALLPQINKFGIVQEKKQNEIVDLYIEKLGIKTTGRNQIIRNLSGGNQQKVMLARWMCLNPKLIILDEPTRGIDVGAKAEIESLIRTFSETGISVLMISSEMEELERNCDRVAVIRDGRKIAELINQDISQEKIMQIIAVESSIPGRKAIS